MKFEDKVTIDEMGRILDSLKKVYIKKELVDSFDELVKNLPILLEDVTYDPEIDKVVLLVDRDRNSFTEKQYDYVSEQCLKNDFIFLITNPCFEFFLALHLDNCLSISQNELLENKCDEMGNTFMFNKLKELDPSYKKEKFDPERFVNLSATAFNNSINYANSVEELKTKIGTNIPNWLMSLN